AHEGERYQTALRASGGNKTYTFTVDGLPEGIEFRVLDTLAGPLPVIEGIPALGTVGQYLVRIRVEDSSVPPMTQLDGLILEVLPDDNAPKPLRFHTTSLPPATSGEFYDPVLIEISGGTPDYSLTMSGTPTGLALEYDARIGAWIFYGTTEISKPRSFPVTFTATDASSPMLTTSVTILLSVYVTEEGMPPPLEPDGQAASIGVPVLNGAAAAPQCSLSSAPSPAGIPVPALLALMVAFLIKVYGRCHMDQDVAHPH
ncbi:MAG: hypothetical protein L6Q71_06925, partial [Planctomycetes bacterium]|nr:hypothetical protein [Planctomycetota bacterium]